MTLFFLFFSRTAGYYIYARYAKDYQKMVSPVSSLSPSSIAKAASRRVISFFSRYSYEPWHIRYIDDVARAKDITARGITLEEYLL